MTFWVTVRRPTDTGFPRQLHYLWAKCADHVMCQEVRPIERTIGIGFWHGFPG